VFVMRAGTVYKNTTRAPEPAESGKPKR